MNSKDLIIQKLENLKKIYDTQKDKKWNSKALLTAIQILKKYNGPITSGKQLQTELKGIGEKIALRIDEILKTGNLEELNDSSLDNSFDNSYDKLLDITGVGPTRAKKWIEMNIKNIDDLKKAISENKIKSTHHIDIGIKYYEDFQKKIPREEIDRMNIFLKKAIKKIDNNLIFEICGSYRRGMSQSGDIDILVSHPDFYENIKDQQFLKKIIKELEKQKFIIDHLTSAGDTKFMGVCKLDNSPFGRRIDIRVVNYSSYFTALIYFTGSKDFNVQIRNKALANNYTLNEYALTDLNNNNLQILKNEEEIFEILKLSYLTPNERNI